MTPFQALHGYEPPNWNNFVLKNTNVTEVRNQLEITKEIIKSLQDNLNMAQNRMRKQADQHRTKREYEEGDQVFVRLQPYKQLSLKQGGKNKLAPKFYGPYWITTNISQVVYELDLPH